MDITWIVNKVFTLSVFPQAPAWASTSYQTTSLCILTEEQLRTTRFPESGFKPMDNMAAIFSPIWIWSRPQMSWGGWTCPVTPVLWSTAVVPEVLDVSVAEVKVWDPGSGVAGETVEFGPGWTERKIY